MAAIAPTALPKRGRAGHRRSVALVTPLLVIGALLAPLAHQAIAATDLRLLVWGLNGRGNNTQLPSGDLSGLIAAETSGDHIVALKSDGTVAAGGSNWDGPYDYAGQATVPAGLSGVTAVSAGRAYNLVLKSDGTVVAWGANGAGQATVPAGLSGVTAVSAGGYHSLALKSDGTVVAWGDNRSGQTAVPAGLAEVVAVSAGSDHSLALKSDGTVVAWGANGSGQVTVPAGLSGVVDVSAGGRYSLALKSDGTVVAWGDNEFGQTAVPAALTGVVDVDAGSAHSLALKSDGTVVGWGYPAAGGPAEVPPGLRGVLTVSAGGLTSLVLQDATPFVSYLRPTAGPLGGGNSVDIIGSGFSGATAVHFGPTAATSYTLKGDTHITAIAPAGTAGAVDVTVTTPKGTTAPSGSGTNTSALGAGSRYTYMASPTVTGLSPSVSHGGYWVVISGTGFSGSTLVSFGERSAERFTVDSDTQITAVAPFAPLAPVDVTVDVTVTAPGGISATSTASRFTYVGTPLPTVSGLSPDVGPADGGNPVVIVGTGFSNAMAEAVRFGPMTASYTVDSDTQITAIAPAGAPGTTVDVTVKTSTGTSEPSPASRYTFLAAAAPAGPTMSGLSPHVGPAEGGNSVVITGSGFTGTTEVWFGPRAPASGFTVDSDTQITAIAPPRPAGTVHVRVLGPGGWSPRPGAPYKYA